MTLTKKSPCKVNLILNILGKRVDGFHELETVMHPVNLFDELTFERGGTGIQLTCSEPGLPVDGKNLVYRAAEAFLKFHKLEAGVRIHLEKKIPMAAGLGGGSGNAATTLLGMNEVFGSPLTTPALGSLAAALGSDINFFLQEKPALAKGRGEHIESLEFFPALRGTYIFLVHPGFGISTPWAYQQLANFPAALNGTPGRAQTLVDLLQREPLEVAAREFYNSLEAPALQKYPLLTLFQEFFRENGAAVALMSGSGSTTFGITPNRATAIQLREKFLVKFGESFWTAIVPLGES
ncbi:MAG: 4-diphosphocytidyl-2-C-methyl-D-erythritol kinase [Verrucomicrobiales bacterium]|nr:4-diphosphocytidyl-2-C-methyl-D-erythritol kinase [Verrucomicrobiales bacterium]